jgi:undecaprenyl-diphosphatase
VGINQPIVNAVHEARPYTDHPGVLVLATRSADFSFPSDHAVMAGAVAVGLVFVSRRLAALAGVAAVAMAVARVYIAAHYPADVAVGLVLGAAVALVVYLLAHRLVASAVFALVAGDSRLRPLLTASRPGSTATPSSR